MRRDRYHPGQWDPHVPADLREPFRWAHPNAPRSTHPFSRPIGTLMFGVAMVVAGVGLSGSTLAHGVASREGEALFAGISLLMIFGGVGAWAVVLGAIRLAWQRRFTRRFGFSPFERSP